MEALPASPVVPCSKNVRDAKTNPSQPGAAFGALEAFPAGAGERRLELDEVFSLSLLATGSRRQQRRNRQDARCLSFRFTKALKAIRQVRSGSGGSSSHTSTISKFSTYNVHNILLLLG